MNKKYTICPRCVTQYSVSFLQLTIAQGMVNCPKCDLNFNALNHLVALHKKEELDIPEDKSSLAQKLNKELYNHHPTVEILHKKPTNSTIDLLTYLNSVNYATHSKPNAVFPNMSMMTKNQHSPNSVRAKNHIGKWKYYFFLLIAIIYFFVYIIYR